jgi:hypothetical protein
VTEKVPAVANMKLYVCPVCMTGDDRVAFAELTWWSTASEFVHVIDSPGWIVTEEGTNPVLVIVMFAACANAGAIPTTARTAITKKSLRIA